MENYFVLLALLGGLAAIGAMTRLASAAAKRMSGGSGPSEDVKRRLEDAEQRLAETEARLDELSATDGRLAELDERLEFAERLLQQQRERQRLPPSE